MWNPIELVYMVIFNLYKFLSSKSRTLETLWYRLDEDCFKPEIIRITKHYIFGIGAMTLIDNKTLNEREYIFRWVSYQEVVDTYQLYTLRTMMLSLKESGIRRMVYSTVNGRAMYIHTLDPKYKASKYHTVKTVKDISDDGKVGSIKMNMFYGYRDNKLCVLGIPADILLMLDVNMTMFDKAIDSYIKHYHRVSYQLLAGLK